jgi:hypothetical protein
MKVFKITLSIIDFDEVGEEGIKDVLEGSSYPNDCIDPKVEKIESRDIGGWYDDHPLNCTSTAATELERLFSNVQRNDDEQSKEFWTAIDQAIKGEPICIDGKAIWTNGFASNFLAKILPLIQAHPNARIICRPDSCDPFCPDWVEYDSNSNTIFVEDFF